MESNTRKILIMTGVILGMLIASNILLWYKTWHVDKFIQATGETVLLSEKVFRQTLDYNRQVIEYNRNVDEEAMKKQLRQY